MPNKVILSNAMAADAAKRDASRTNNLRPGNRNLARIRKAPVLERASVALGGIFGPEIREVAYCVSVGVQRGTITPTIGKLILERVLPSSRPVPLDLPEILGPAELLDAEQKIARAMNEGRISPAEALQLQAWAKTAYRSRKIADAAMGRRWPRGR